MKRTAIVALALAAAVGISSAVFAASTDCPSPCCDGAGAMHGHSQTSSDSAAPRDPAMDSW